jgi:hypothetical protein
LEVCGRRAISSAREPQRLGQRVWLRHVLHIPVRSSACAFKGKAVCASESTRTFRSRAIRSLSEYATHHRGWSLLTAAKLAAGINHREISPEIDRLERALQWMQISNAAAPTRRSIRPTQRSAADRTQARAHVVAGDLQAGNDRWRGSPARCGRSANSARRKAIMRLAEGCPSDGRDPPFSFEGSATSLSEPSAQATRGEPSRAFPCSDRHARAGKPSAGGAPAPAPPHRKGANG